SPFGSLWRMATGLTVQNECASRLLRGYPRTRNNLNKPARLPTLSASSARLLVRTWNATLAGSDRRPPIVLSGPPKRDGSKRLERAVKRATLTSGLPHTVRLRKRRPSRSLPDGKDLLLTVIYRFGKSADDSWPFHLLLAATTIGGSRQQMASKPEST